MVLTRRNNGSYVRSICWQRVRSSRGRRNATIGGFKPSVPAEGFSYAGRGAPFVLPDRQEIRIPFVQAYNPPSHNFPGQVRYTRYPFHSGTGSRQISERGGYRAKGRQRATKGRGRALANASGQAQGGQPHQTDNPTRPPITQLRVSLVKSC